MVKPGQGKFPIFEGNKIKFNIHSNFCGLSDCINFKSCGQALREIDKFKYIDEGLIPQIDREKGSKVCYSEKPVEKPEGKLEIDTTPDWPARKM